MLVRRVREACRAAQTLQCIGTSATMSTAGTVAEQQRDVAAVASRIFGADVLPEHVITETLVRATTQRSPSVAALAEAVRVRGHAEAVDPTLTAGYDVLRGDPLASWVEDTFGLAEEQESGRLVRRQPTTVDAAAAQLAADTGEPATSCAIAIRAALLAGSRARQEGTGRGLAEPVDATLPARSLRTCRGGSGGHASFRRSPHASPARLSSRRSMPCRSTQPRPTGFGSVTWSSTFSTAASM